jgi:GntP family gluconate:H+ symporter
VGFMTPLAIVTIPIAIFSALFLCMKYISGPLHVERILEALPPIPQKMKGIRIYLPLFVAIGLMLSARAFPHYIPHLGIPLVFVIGTGVAVLAGGRLKFMQVSTKAFNDTFTINGILLAVGALVQIMALTGVRGLFVISAITAPMLLLYLGIFIGFPLFAGILTSFGAASVFGIPLMLALLGRDPIIATIGLSLVATVGNLVPPTAILGKPAAIVADYREPYKNVFHASLIPLLVILIVGTSLIIFANPLRFIRW